MFFINAEFYKNLQVVLTKYHESYKVDENGKVLIKRKLANDKELVFNYTNKALDTALLFRNRKDAVIQTDTVFDLYGNCK